MIEFHSSDATRVKAVILSAHRRRLLVLTIEQLAFALAVVISGGILMLLMGTQILDWRWLALLSVPAVAITATRLRHRMLNRYLIAQILDERLRLADSLSTAWFLLTQCPDSEGHVSRFQIEQAEQLAGSVNPAIAFPFRYERAWVLVAGLSTIFFGLFIARYLVQGKLSFEQSLIPIQFGSVIERLEQSLSAKTQLPTDSAPTRQQRSALDAAQDGQNDEATASVRQTTASGANAHSADRPANRKSAVQQNAEPETGRNENSTSESRPSALSANALKNSDLKQAAPQPALNAQNPSSTGVRPSASLLNRMEDALSGLLGKMGYARNPKRSPQNSDTFQAASAENASGNDKREQTSRANRDGRAATNQTSETTERTQTAERSESSQGHGSDGSSNRNGSDAQSGIGSQDGEKRLKEAEQLRAMGKLAEIIGKRSASVTGEVVIETNSGKQQLKTEYSKQLGRHSDLGGEINRDEIPMIYQQYVREYMERVHQQPRK